MFEEEQECEMCKEIVKPIVDTKRGGERGYRETLYWVTRPRCKETIYKDTDWNKYW